MEKLDRGMNPDLARQQEAFKRSLQRQPVIERKVAPSVAAASNPTQASSLSLSSIESLSEELRFEDNAGGRHINSYVHAIISFLKPLGRRAHYDEIRDRLNIDIDGIPELLEKILRNDRISAADGYLSFNVEDFKPYLLIFALLEDHANSGGILVQDLIESNLEVANFIQARISSGDIIAFKGKDDQPRVLFHNPAKKNFQLEEKFKILWNSQMIPVASDLDVLLAKAGLKSADLAMTDKKQPLASASKAKPARKFNKRTKITNTHIEGLDFSKDSPSV